MELSVEKANVDLETGTIIITGYDVSEIISEVGVQELLNTMDYLDIKQFVIDIEEEKEQDRLAELDRRS